MQEIKDYISELYNAAGYKILRETSTSASKEVIIKFTDDSNIIRIFTKTFKGTINTSVVHPREVFNAAIVNHAAAIIAAHNHPSGDPTPSKEDKSLTSSLAESGKIIGIPVLDHIIVGNNSYFSFKEHCLL